MDPVSSTDEWTSPSLNISQHWRQLDFEDVFESVSIASLKVPQKEYLSSGRIPVIDQGAELVGGYTNDESKCIKSTRPLIVFGDHTKCFKLVGFPFAPGADGVKVLRTTAIDERFAYYACKALRLPDRGYSRHYAFLKKSKIPIAPQKEQLRIVEKIEELFSELDKGIESLKTARRQLEVYRQSVLKHAFEGKLTAQWREENKGKLETPDRLLARVKQDRVTRYDRQLREWQSAVTEWGDAGKKGTKPPKPKVPKEVAEIPDEIAAELLELSEGWLWLRLDSIADVVGGITKNQTRIRFTHRMKYLRVANVYADKILTDNVHEIGVTEAEARKIALEVGDLLVVEGNGSMDQIGRVAMWHGELPVCGHQNHLIRVRVANGYDPRFVLLFLLSPQGRDLIVEEASSTSGLHTLSISKVSNLVVPVTSPAEEAAVVAAVDEKLEGIDRAVEKIDRQFAKSEALRQSILKKAFSGRLVAQYPNDEPASVLLDRIRAEKRQSSKRDHARPHVHEARATS